MATISPEPPVANRRLAGKYLTFLLGGGSYGIAVSKVREIIRLPAITALPRLPVHFKGVINLRGRIVPVVDLRSRFGMPGAESNERSCIVVALVDLGSGTQSLMGLIVDGTEEVAPLGEADIEPAPEFGAGLDTRFILGMAKVNHVVKTLIDIDNILNADAATQLRSQSLQ